MRNLLETHFFMGRCNPKGTVTFNRHQTKLRRNCLQQNAGGYSLQILRCPTLCSLVLVFLTLAKEKDVPNAIVHLKDAADPEYDPGALLNKTSAPPKAQLALQQVCDYIVGKKINKCL